MNGVVHQTVESMEGITLTPAAEKHLMAYLIKEQKYQGVRFSVKKTGCSGLSYVLDYVETAIDQDITFPFLQNFQLYIEKKSYPFLKGMKVDYVKQGLNYKLIFQNPNQTGQCGCGESFTVESV